MAKKFFIRTFGCQMNEYDSQKIADVLSHDGATAAAAAAAAVATDDAKDADIIVFNTCSVRERAQEKVFSDLGVARALKQKKPDMIIGVGGCVASQEGQEIIRRAPYVDVVFGPQTLHRLPALIKRRRETGEPQVDISFPEIEKFDRLPQPRARGPVAYVSVMEGCSKYCSFCVVPYTRGEEVSRPLPSVLDEIARLAETGCREVTLLGQNVNAYRARIDGALVDFADLLAAVCDIPGIERVRFITSHPVEFTDHLIDAYRELPKLPDYLHLPAQSGCDRVLMRMKRGYTALEYKSIIRRLRKARPGILIASDFIVGFPGESDNDFEQTMKFVDDIKFDFSYSFLYSPRPGTPAASYADDTPAEIKSQRLHRLQAALEANGREYSAMMVGRAEQVLVTGAAKRGGGKMQGRCANMRVVNFKGDDSLIGQIVPVHIRATAAHTLLGDVIGADGDAPAAETIAAAGASNSERRAE